MTNVHEALDGLGTKERLLNDVVLSRTNADLAQIKGLYQQRYGKSLAAAVADDLSLKTEKMFDMVLNGVRMEEFTPIDMVKVANDTDDIYRATTGRGVGTDELLVCAVLTNRSDQHIRAIADNYFSKYGQKLAELIKHKFSGHMEDALLHIVKHAVNVSVFWAEMLEDTMAGMGTKDYLLIERVVRIHWDHGLVRAVKQSYQAIYGKDLIRRVKGETSGDYEKVLVAMLSV